jgi:electron transfer flavoprotein beta subunit
VEETLKIIVLVKHVPDAQFDRHLTGEGNTADRSESILSELDEYALEAALQLIEARGGEAAGNKVIALSMGPAAAVNAVKKSLQIGATEGVHLSDEALAGSDAAATSLALAAAIRHLGADAPADLIVTGMASTDGETSLVPAQLAERLGLPQVTFAASLELDGGKLTARRDGDTHADTVEAELPAVVSVTDQINDPRYPNFKGIMAAKKKTITTLSLADIGVDAAQVGKSGSWTAVETAEARPPRTAGTIITDEGDAGIQLVEFLAAQKLL